MTSQSLISQQILMYKNEVIGDHWYKSDFAPRGTPSRIERRAAEKARKAFWREKRNAARLAKEPLSEAPRALDGTSRQTWRYTTRKAYGKAQSLWQRDVAEHSVLNANTDELVKDAPYVNESWK